MTRRRARRWGERVRRKFQEIRRIWGKGRRERKGRNKRRDAAARP
jgi:hypothetical protein